MTIGLAGGGGRHAASPGGEATLCRDRRWRGAGRALGRPCSVKPVSWRRWLATALSPAGPQPSPRAEMSIATTSGVINRPHLRLSTGRLARLTGRPSKPRNTCIRPSKRRRWWLPTTALRPGWKRRSLDPAYQRIRLCLLRRSPWRSRYRRQAQRQLR
jgi:hypothetical protein